MTPALDFIRSYVGEAKFAEMEALGKYNQKTNYIGPQSWTSKLKIAAKIARNAYGLDFNPAGWCHDRLYSIGGGEKEREQADTAFLVVMNHIIDTESSKIWGVGRIQRNLARSRALKLYALVRENGEHFFTYR
jgi:hypothetical protein